MYANTQAAVADSLYPGGAYPYDPNLEGIFDVIAAPFKAVGRAAGSVGRTVGRTVVRVAPRAVAGFIAGGPAGAAVGAGSALIGGGSAAVGAPDAVPDLYYDMNTGRPVSSPPLVASRRGVSVGQILATAGDAAKQEATRQLVPYVEPVIRPHVEERLRAEAKGAAIDMAKIAVPVGLLALTLLARSS